MGALSTDAKKNKSDSAEGGDGDNNDGAGSCSASNGDNKGADSVDAKDTLFVKELRAKGQVRGGCNAMPCSSSGHVVLVFFLLCVHGVGRTESVLAFLAAGAGAGAAGGCPCCGSRSGS